MPKNFHSVGSAKKMLSYGAKNGLGPFRKQPGKKNPTANSQAIQNLKGAENNDKS